MPRLTRRDLLKVGFAASAGAMAASDKLRALALPQASAGAQPPLGPASISINTSGSQDSVVKFAAQELVRYLGRITGERISLGHPGASHKIYLAAIPTAASASEQSELLALAEALAEDGFLIRSLRRDIVILGKGSRGVLYGCYAFLESLGVRWYFPGEEHEIVPRHAVDWDRPLQIKESPAVSRRVLFYWPNNFTSVNDWIDFCAKVRINRVAFHYTWPARDWYILLREKLLPELARRGLEIEAGGHFLSTFLPRTLVSEHPEWFRMDERGKRSNDFNLNPFNQDAVEHLAAGSVEYMSKMPEVSLFHLWADDIWGGGWSHEPGKGDYTPSDQSLLVANSLVKKLRRELPKAKLAYLAYHDTVSPPKIVKPEPGLTYLYAPRERCYAHALSDPACSLNRLYAQALEKGLTAFGGENAEVFEYYVDQILFENMANPPMPKVISADVEYYRGLGIPAIGALMTQTSDFVTPLPNMFLYPQALWDPARDLNRSLDEYASLYFGDGEMAAYFAELATGMAELLKVCRYIEPGDAWDAVRVDGESAEALQFHVDGLEKAIVGPLKKAAAILDSALRTAQNADYLRRLRGEQTSMTFTLLQVRLYYHLLKGELFHRAWQVLHDQEAGLGVLTEHGLARFSWEQQRKFIAKSGMMASPQIPRLQELESRARELTDAGTTDPKSAIGVNVFGYAIDRLDEQLMNGITGFMMAGPTGSRAVLWRDGLSSEIPLHAESAELVYCDEFSAAIKVGSPGSFASPLVVAGKGIAVDKLFAAILSATLRPI